MNTTIGRWATGFALVCLCSAAIAQGHSRSMPSQRSPAKLAACRQNLETISKALKAYERDHKSPPEWLSDLYPRYVSDRRVFHCPADSTPGTVGTKDRPSDPHAPVSYEYEINLKPGVDDY